MEIGNDKTIPEHLRCARYWAVPKEKEKKITKHQHRKNYSQKMQDIWELRTQLQRYWTKSHFRNQSLNLSCIWEQRKTEDYFFILFLPCCFHTVDFSHQHVHLEDILNMSFIRIYNNWKISEGKEFSIAYFFKSLDSLINIINSEDKLFLIFPLLLLFHWICLN